MTTCLQLFLLTHTCSQASLVTAGFSSFQNAQPASRQVKYYTTNTNFKILHHQHKLKYPGYLQWQTKSQRAEATVGSEIEAPSRTSSAELHIHSGQIWHETPGSGFSMLGSKESAVSELTDLRALGKFRL